MNPEMRHLARWLLEREAFTDESAEVDGFEGVRVCEKLRTPLSALAGVAGYYSLLSRAVTLAGAEAASLGAAQFKLDGSLDGLSAVDSQERLDAAMLGGEILVAHLLGLLATFIGQRLTLSLLRDVWPDAPFGDTDPKPETRS